MAGGDQKARARGQLKVFFGTDRFGSKPGPSGMSGLPPGADIAWAPPHVRFVPTAAIAPQQIGSLFDHLVGATEQNRRHFQPYRLGRLQIDHKFELRRLLDSQLARIRSLKNLVDICCKPLE